MHGEQSANDKENDWIKTVLLSLLENYEEKDIHNANELRLFYKELSNRTTASKVKKLKERKNKETN